MAHGWWKTALQTAESVAIVLAGVAVVITLSTGRPILSTVRSAAVGPPEPEDIRDRHLSVSLNDTPTLGSDNAKVAVVEFSDFQCPFCGQYARETLPLLRKEFVDTTRVRFAFKHFPLEQIHGLANDAAKQAICAGEQFQFWQMHDRLFDEQSKLSRQFLLTTIADLRLDADAFDKCLQVVGDRITADEVDGRRLGVTSTPTFFLGRLTDTGSLSIATRIAGAYPYETFSAAIKALLNE